MPGVKYWYLGSNDQNNAHQVLSDRPGKVKGIVHFLVGQLLDYAQDPRDIFQFGGQSSFVKEENDYNSWFVTVLNGNSLIQNQIAVISREEGTIPHHHEHHCK